MVLYPPTAAITGLQQRCHHDNHIVATPRQPHRYKRGRQVPETPRYCRKVMSNQINLVAESRSQTDIIQYNTIHCNTIQYNTIQHNTTQYNTIQYNTIHYNAIQYNTIQYTAIQYSSSSQLAALFLSALLSLAGQGLLARGH